MSHPAPKEYDWQITLPVRGKFQRLVNRLRELDEHDMEAVSLREEIRRLPGYPTAAKPWDIVNFVSEARLISIPKKVN